MIRKRTNNLAIVLKKGFTLIEMLVVIMIMGIMMTMVIRFGGDYVDVIQAKEVREQRQQGYEQIRRTAMTSSYHQNQKFTDIMMTIDAQGIISYQYRSDTPDSDTDNSTDSDNNDDYFIRIIDEGIIYPSSALIKTASQNNTGTNNNNTQNISSNASSSSSNDEYTIHFTSYQLGCTIWNSDDSDETPLDEINLVIDQGGKDMCFHIQNTVCRIEQVACTE